MRISLDASYWKLPVENQEAHACAVALNETWGRPGFWKVGISGRQITCGPATMSLELNEGFPRVVCELRGPATFDVLGIDIGNSRLALADYRKLVEHFLAALAGTSRHHEERVAALEAKATRLLEAYTEERMEVQATIENLKDQLRSARMQAAGREA